MLKFSLVVVARAVNFRTFDLRAFSIFLLRLRQQVEYLRSRLQLNIVVPVLRHGSNGRGIEELPSVDDRRARLPRVPSLHGHIENLRAGWLDMIFSYMPNTRCPPYPSCPPSRGPAKKKMHNAAPPARRWHGHVAKTILPPY